MVVQPGVGVPLLPGDHEGGQRGRVDGQEDHGEQGPNGGHEAGRERPRAVHADRGLEEQGPDQPVGPEQGKLVVGIGRKLKLI